MKKPVTDQADGLRRLMANSPGRLLAFVGGAPGVGVSSVTMNLAAALARLGQDVQVIDECGGVPAAYARLQGRLVLVDARLDGEGLLSPLAAQADELVVVLRPQVEAITAAYACIKRLQQAHALQRMRVLVNHAVGANDANRILANLASVAKSYLALALEPAGCIREDVQLAQARWLNMSVVEAFPGSPAALDVDRLAGDLLRWPAPPENRTGPVLPVAAGVTGEVPARRMSPAAA
ncbi:MinD/ParA family protein [Polaromonas sp. LjRoot131]|uniref:MinD/ParA family ATP-binding protein n=1 Tax=Polaromonas sp. LjRoot131 TaxID=3342262 RepID=UPI003ECEBF3F